MKNIMIRGVIFDLDGVLVHTDELHFRAWSCIAEELKIYSAGIALALAAKHTFRISRLRCVPYWKFYASGSYGWQSARPAATPG